MTEQNEARAVEGGAGRDDRATKGSGHEHYTPDSLARAIAYAQRGLAVFPLRPGGKIPYPGSRGHLDATTNAERLTAIWPDPAANIGIATGAVSGVWVLDVDDPDALDPLLAQHGTLPTTAAVETPRGGFHFWYRYPTDREVPCSAGQIGRGLDVRGEGGYVVASPSRLADGRGYRWLTRRAEIVDAPAWLLDLAATRGAQQFAEPIVGTIGDGQRNVALTSLAGSMRDRGCEADEILALLRVANAKRCDPPLADREVGAVARSVCRYAPGRAWWAAGEAEDAAADAWLTEVQDEAAARRGGAR